MSRMKRFIWKLERKLEDFSDFLDKEDGPEPEQRLAMYLKQREEIL